MDWSESCSVSTKETNYSLIATSVSVSDAVGVYVGVVYINQHCLAVLSVVFFQLSATKADGWFHVCECVCKVY